MKTKFRAVAFTRQFGRSGPLLGAVLGLALGASAAVTPLRLGLTEPGSFNESNRAAFLTWAAEADRIYKVQISTNIGDPAAWETRDLVSTNAAGPVRWKDSEGLRAGSFFQLLLPQPEIRSVEPSFVNSDDPGALFYLTGQLLPTNGVVVVNGQNFTVTAFDPNGSWIAISLNGLPPGTPVTGNILVLDNGSNIVTALPLQNPVTYGTALTLEQLQGPPAEPPASPSRVLKTKTKSNQSNDRWSASDDDEDGDPAAGVAIPKFINVTAQAQQAAMKADIGAIRTAGGGAGGSLGGSAPDLQQGKSTPVTRSNISNNRSAGGGGGVSAASGELKFEEVDLAIPGRGLDFAWTRTYRSRAEATTAQGSGWDFSYNVSATAQPDGTLVLRPGNGRADTFYPNGTNGWTRDEYFLHIRDLDQDGAPDVVVFPDTGKWLLHPPGTALAGKLAQIVDRNGNTIRCDYDLNTGRLLQVVDTLDRTNTVAYDSKGFIESVTDFTGRTVRYEYNSGGDLTASISPVVTGTPTGNDFPGGKTNRYAYSTGSLDERLNHNLLSITDPKGQVALEVTYHGTNNPASLDFDAVDSFVCGTTAHLRRFPQTPTPANQFTTVKAVFRDRAGNVSESFLDSRQRGVRLREYTGRAPNLTAPVTENSNRPVGKLRAEDPDYFETRWEWNADSLCTREIRPDGGSTEIIHQRAFNQNSSRSNNAKAALHDGDVRVIRQRASSAVDTDGDGVADTTERVWRFDYDARFGSPMKSGHDFYLPIKRGKMKAYNQNNARSNHAKSGFNESMPLSVLHVGNGIKDIQVGEVCDDGNTTSGDGCNSDCKVNRTAGEQCDNGLDNNSDSFVISATDPRGNVVTASYDAAGNRIVRKLIPVTQPDIAGAHRNFAYNQFGQLTAITNAADANGYRAVTRYVYGDDPFTPQVEPPLPFAIMAIADADGLKLTNRFEYDPRGNVTRAVDARGHDTLFTYNALDQPVQVQTPAYGGSGSLPPQRVTRQYFYDANDNVVRADLDNRDETGAPVAANPQWTTLFEHDALDRLTGIVEEISEGGVLPASYTTNRFVYDANDNLIEARSPLAVNGTDPHNTVAIEYDERGLLFREIGAPGSPVQTTTQYDYDVNGNVSRVSEGLEGVPSVTTLEYDGFTRLGVGVWAVPGSFPPPSAAARSAASHRAIALDLLVRADDGDRLSKIIDPLGNVTTFHYDANSNLKVIRHFGETNDVPGSAGNRLLAETRYQYDSLDRPVRQVDSFFDIFTGVPIGDGQATTSFTYAPNGQCIAVTNDLGHATTYDYDTAGRVYLVKTPRTVVQSSTINAHRDEAGNIVRVTQTDYPDLGGPPQVFAWTNVFDSLNRLVSTTDNVGNTNRYACDSRGNLVSYLSPREDETYRVYDGLGRCVAATNYVGKERGITINTSHVEYNTTRLVAATDNNGNTTTYAYDSLDRLVQITAADGTSSSLVWSPRSNLVREQDANGTVITNVYDPLDRVVVRVITPGPAVVPTTTFETFAYDGFSRVVSASNNVSLSTFDYDSIGNLVRTTQDGLTTAATFDALGNTLSQTYPGGRVITYTYDALNQPASLSSSSGGGLPPTVLAQLAYDGPGRLGGLARANGVNTRHQWNGLVSPSNAAGDFGWLQVRGINHQTAGNGPIVDRRIAAYDRSQNRVLRAQTAPFVFGGDTLTNTLEYDALDRLRLAIKTKGTSAQRVDYSLDGNGNRLEVAVDFVPQPYVMDNAFPDPADFQVNQYTVTPFGNQSHDQNGNLIARINAFGPTFYLYDYADRLVQVNGINGEGFLGPIASYSYDALGRRISKTTYPGGGLPPAVTQFVHDGDAIIEERSNGTLKRTYAFPHVFEHKDRITFTDTGATLYSHDDDLGNSLALTDASGAVVERYEYDDFGLPQFLSSDGFPIATNASPAGNPFLFHGLEWDAETGLFLDQAQSGGVVPSTKLSKADAGRSLDATIDARHYDPKTAREINGGMPNRISMNVTVPKQTQGATFGEKVNQGLHTAGGTRAGISTSRSNIRNKSSFHSGSNPWSGGRKAQYNPKEVVIDKSVPWQRKAASPTISAGFVAKKNNGQLAGKK